MKIIVLGGCGDMGSYVVRDLLEYSDTEVTIADYRLNVARGFADELGKRVQAVFVDAEGGRHARGLRPRRRPRPRSLLR